jgi:hypothetical protein
MLNGGFDPPRTPRPDRLGRRLRVLVYVADWNPGAPHENPTGDDDRDARCCRRHLGVARKVAEGMKDVGLQVADLSNGLVAIGRRDQGQSRKLHGGYQAVSNGPPGPSPCDDALEATPIERAGEAFDAGSRAREGLFEHDVRCGAAGMMNSSAASTTIFVATVGAKSSAIARPTAGAKRPTLHERSDQVVERRALDGRKHDRGRHAGVTVDIRQSLNIALINGHERGVIGIGVVAAFLGQAIGRDLRRGAASHRRYARL